MAARTDEMEHRTVISIPSDHSLLKDQTEPKDALNNNTCSLLSGMCRGVLRLHGSRAGEYSVYTALGPGSTPFTRF